MVGDPLTNEPAPTTQTVLSALADEDCRSLLEAMTSPKTASELSEESGVPLSTTYRKIELLEDATLIDEQIEIRDDGRHTSRYEPAFEHVEITQAEDHTLTYEINRPPRTADERLEELWTEVRKGV